MRHGESFANARGIYQGQTYDTGLTQNGECQASLVAKALVKRPITRLYTSCLLRTRQTAEIIGAEIGLVPVYDQNIIEISHGLWEGHKKEWVKKYYQEELNKWQTCPTKAQMPAGENIFEVSERVKKFLIRLKAGRNLIVTHDAVIRVIICNFLGMSLDNIWKIHLDNCGFTLIDSGKLLILNENNHLNQLADVAGQAL